MAQSLSGESEVRNQLLLDSLHYLFLPNVQGIFIDLIDWLWPLTSEKFSLRPGISLRGEVHVCPKFDPQHCQLTSVPA